MIKPPMVIILLLVFCSGVFAQGNSFSVSGTVVDSTAKDVIEMASVALKAPGNATILTAATADMNGQFNLKIKPGKYELLVAFMGYNKKVLPVTINADVKLGKIYLSQSVTTLQEAVIVAERPEITVTAEKITLNVAQSPISQVGTAEDALRNMPGLSVDQDGNLSLLGKQGVKVLVDGRPNAMADNDLQGFLRSLPANSIESVELITSPSARYDASGSAGIVNIKLKKGKADGMNISLSGGYGISGRYNGNANVNYRKNKFNLFSNYSANASNTSFVSTANRAISVNDSTSYYRSRSTGTQKRFNNNLKAGFDYFINDNTTLTYTALANYTHSNNFTNGNSANLDATEQPMAAYNSFNQALNNTFTINNSLTYVKKYDSTDRELDLSASHSYTGAANHTTLNSLAFDSTGAFTPANDLNQQTNSPNSAHNIMLKADYVYPISKLKGYKIEAGAKNETSINKNTFDDYNVTSSNIELDTLLSNKIGYVQNIAAAYANLRGAYKKWFTFSGGLRGEHTYIHGNDDAVNKDYFNLFPSAGMAITFNDTQNLSVSYSRRIQRPPFRYINSSITYSDQFTSWQGNPLLQASFSDNIGLSYSHSINKQLFVMQAGGSVVSNGFTNIASVDSNRITRGTEVNGVDSKSCNISVYTRLHLTRWWEAQAYYNFSYIAYGFTEGINLNSNSGSTNNIWGMMRFKFWSNTAFEVSGWCNTRTVSAQGASLPVGAMYASIKKSFLKDHLTVSVAANDILNTLKWQWTQENAGIQSTGSWQGGSRSLMMTLTYHFGSNDFDSKKQKEEEHLANEDGKG